MLTKAQEKLIRSLQTKKARLSTGLCLVEGAKVVAEAGNKVEYTFGPKDTKKFNQLVTTETPQEIAAVARTPEYQAEDVTKFPTIVVLDGVQDPGNVGSILRLCLGFEASLVLVESADPTSPKVIRSSAGAMFHVPWLQLSRAKIDSWLAKLKRPVARLEQVPGAKPVADLAQADKLILIAGSEGQGIKLAIKGRLYDSA